MTDSEKLNKEYDFEIRKFCQRFEDSIKAIEKKLESRTAYVFLFNRDINDSVGNVDVASNLSTESIIHTLQEIIDTLNKQAH